MYTCIRLPQEDMATLDQRASSTGTTRSSILAEVMRKLAHRRPALSSFRRVQYQSRQKEIKWKTLHIRVNEADYEFFLDMRKFMKKSVSFLLSIAIRKYLGSSISCKSNYENKNTYNYHNYIISCTKTEGGICWKIYWGMPESTEILIPLRI